jgi:hypothetical protein
VQIIILCLRPYSQPFGNVQSCIHGSKWIPAAFTIMRGPAPFSEGYLTKIFQGARPPAMGIIDSPLRNNILALKKHHRMVSLPAGAAA